MPKLSFIVPVFNPNREVFNKAVKSISDQALTDWEAIYVLDGPSSVANDVLSVYKHDTRFKVIEMEHGGAQKARNKGGELATGEFFCFFDSDCVIEPGASRMWVEQFEKHPEVGFIYSGHRFFGEKWAFDSEPFDPWTLRIRNYVSGCFPMRASLYPGWTDGLKSLQDWDMWLSLLEKAEKLGWDIHKVGMFIRGYAFVTPLPSPGSISHDGCKPENWLERMDAVKSRHGLKDRDICVSSLQYRHDGMALARKLDADFLAIANDKPHRYKTIIQVGFSLGKNIEKHSAMFQEKDTKKILFWTGDNINELWNAVNGKTIDSMCKLLNDCTTQYCEDKEAQRLISRWGFKVEILPLPIGEAKILPMPEVKKWVIDMSSDYSPVISVVARSLPDIDIEMIDSSAPLGDYVGLIHFFPDRSMSTTIKRALLSGRHVISNVQQPFCGNISDNGRPEEFITDIVTKIRELTSQKANPEAASYYKDSTALMEVIK